MSTFTPVHPRLHRPPGRHQARSRHLLAETPWRGVLVVVVAMLIAGLVTLAVRDATDAAQASAAAAVAAASDPCAKAVDAADALLAEDLGGATDGRLDGWVIFKRENLRRLLADYHRKAAACRSAPTRPGQTP